MLDYQELLNVAEERTCAVGREGFEETLLRNLMEQLSNLGAGAIHDVAEHCKVACQSGCSFCCHMRVVATVPEVLAIADEIRRSWDSRKTSELKHRTSILRRKSRGQTDEQWGNDRHRCPMLADGRCSVYDKRPLDCRAHNSQDVGACERAWIDYLDWDVPVNFHMQASYKHLQAGLLEGLAKMGLPARLVELNAALNIALEDEQARNRWRSGEPIFEDAELDALDPEQLAFTSVPAAKAPWVPSDHFRN